MRADVIIILIVYLFFETGALYLWHINQLEGAATAKLSFATGIECLFFWLILEKNRLAKTAPSRVIRALLPLLLITIYAVQLASLWISGSFLSVIALENAGETQWVESSALYAGFVAAIVLWLVWVVWDNRIQKIALDHASIRTNRRWQQFAVPALILSAAGTALALLPPEKSSRQTRSTEPPALSLATTTFRFLKENPPKWVLQTQLKLLEARTAELSFFRDEVYPTPLPFERTGASISNVIVIFAEGLSSRMLEPYGGRYKDLTPNLRQHAGKFTRVDNYFNHTSATFRGIQGQLVSAYPKAAGSAQWKSPGGTYAASNYSSLPVILRGHGYESHFFSPHARHNPLNNMLTAMGFDRVHTNREINTEFLDGRRGRSTRSLTDVDLFEGIENFLRKRNPQNKLFLATYSVGTHAFRNSPDPAIVYGDGSNPVLNRVHYFDHAFGKFLEYFFQSEYARNTLLILTSDHATYMEPAYTQLMQSEADYKPLFTDMIPLMIFHPGLALPAYMDARSRTSLDFAPTVLHLLDVQKQRHAFLGDSLFESNRRYPLGLAILGEMRIYIKDGNLLLGDEMSPEKLKQYDSMLREIKSYHLMEALGEIR